jgi:protein-disulfide isomerase
MHALVQQHADLRVVFRNLPLPMHERAREAALAALAADRQGQFWAMHDKLFAAHAELAGADFAAFAEALGLDVDRFRADMADPALARQLAEDEAAAARIGVRSTPSSFVNGRWLGGAQPAAAFAPLVEEERARAQARVDAGTPRERVYAEIVAGGIEPGVGGGS